MTAIIENDKKKPTLKALKRLKIVGIS